jgi:hypothetical protein
MSETALTVCPSYAPWGPGGASCAHAAATAKNANKKADRRISNKMTQSQQAFTDITTNGSHLTQK